MNEYEVRALEGRVAALERTLVALRREMRQSVAFGRTTAAPNDTGAVQTVQGRVDGMTVKDAMPVLLHYGFHSVMPPGADKVVLFANGDRSSGVVVATGHQSYRPTGWLLGESGLYDQWVHTIRLTQSGIIINGNGQPITLETGGASAVLNADGSITLTAAGGKTITASAGGTVQAVKLADGTNSTVLRAQ